MRKIIAIIMVAGLAVSANAASFIWGMGADRVQFPATGSFVIDGTATGYLVYLGKTLSETPTVSGYSVTDPVMSTATSTVTGLATTKGRIAGTFNQSAGTALPGTTDPFANGAVFGMYIVKDGWINISSSTYTVSGLVDDTSILANAVFTFNWNSTTAGTPATAGGGWAMVPEPGTAAMALAGLALLIRRRK